MTQPLVFEIAWEVCNRIGGIYTVIKTKAPSMLKRWNSSYFLVGPYNAESAPIEFEEGRPDEPIASTLRELAAAGIKSYFGRWLIEGRPPVVLLDHRSRFNLLAEDKYQLWKDHGLETPADDYYVNESVAFGSCVVEFFRCLALSCDGRPIVAHFHEWMTGLAIPRIRHFKLPVATIFTTHATLLGRYIASDNPQFYHELDSIEPYGAAHRYNIDARFNIERMATHGAHLFTTISEVTARETEKLLGRKPDYLLPNGFNVERFTALHEFQNLHLKYKEHIHEFVMGHFFPSYTFELDRTMYIFTSGRYEYRNKGMDVFIEALYRLNLKLKEVFDPPTIVAFIITSAATKSVNVGALQAHSMFEDLKNTCTELEAVMGRKFLNAVASGRLPPYEELVPNDYQVRLKRAMHARRNKRLPSIVTHDMVDDANDAILQHLRHRNLINAPSDPVKVVFHPQFLDATSPLFDMDYDQFVRGCHLGVFPSSYEPWGYTPLESLALGIPTVTTDLAGFGNFAERNIPNIAENGIYVLKRAHRNADQCIEELTSYLYQFVQLTRRERIELRNRSERLSETFDWSKLGQYYYIVQEAAVQCLK